MHSQEEFLSVIFKNFLQISVTWFNGSPNYDFLILKRMAWLMQNHCETFFWTTNRGLLLSLRRAVCETESQRRRSRYRKSFLCRVCSAQMGDWGHSLRPWPRKGPDHVVGVDPSLLNLTKCTNLTLNSLKEASLEAARAFGWAREWSSGEKLAFGRVGSEPVLQSLHQWACCLVIVTIGQGVVDPPSHCWFHPPCSAFLPLDYQFDRWHSGMKEASFPRGLGGCKIDQKLEGENWATYPWQRGPSKRHTTSIRGQRDNTKKKLALPRKTRVLSSIIVK